MKNKFILSLGILTIGISVTGTTIPTFADSTNEPTTVVDNNQELTPLDRNGIAIGNPTNDLTVTENYLIVSPLLARAASKTIRVTGTMIFDKVGWPSRPPQSRNWKEKRNGYWYYGILYLQSYKSAGNNWIATYSGTLTRK
ncbi:TPA: hypothetical protein ACGU6U_002645 [Enterococcus faecium]